MNPVPKEDDFSEHYPDRYLQGEYLKDEAKFLTKVSKIVEKLRANVPANRLMYNFDFLPQPDTVYAYPEALKDRLLTRDLEGVSLTLIYELSKEGDLISTTPTTSITLFDRDGEMHISRDPLALDRTDDDIVVDKEGTVVAIPRASDTEVTAFVQSLGGLYIESELQLATQEIQTVDAGDLRAALEKNAIQKTRFFEYQLPSEREIRFDTILSPSAVLPEKLNGFSIIYEVGDEAKKMIARINREKGLHIEFYTRLNGEDHTLIPEGGDYVRLVEVINEELAKLRTKRPKQLLSEMTLQALSVDIIDGDILEI